MKVIFLEPLYFGSDELLSLEANEDRQEQLLRLKLSGSLTRGVGAHDPTDLVYAFIEFTGCRRFSKVEIDLRGVSQIDEAGELALDALTCLERQRPEAA